MANPVPAASFKFNQMQEVRSHSSVLYNERLAILFYILDMKSIDLNTYYKVEGIQEVKSVLLQIYKNIRTLIRNNPTMRATLNLETKDQGIYVTDVAFSLIDKMIRWCDVNGYTYKNIYIIVNELNKVETMVKDVLQYFHYFIRPDFRQKPDVELATETYKEIADKQTIEELREIVGKSNKIDFENLGSQRIDLTQKIEYNEEVDGPKNINPLEESEDEEEPLDEEDAD